MTSYIPVVNYLVLDDDPPSAHLVATECTSCGARYFGQRTTCAHCGLRDFTDRLLPDTGRVGSFTIIHRAGKGVPTPFVSALIDLDDGTTVKANIVGCDPTPDAVRLHMPVRLTTFPAAADGDGRVALAFGFEPIPGAPAALEATP
jgi:uncharacterized OB-fold protein